MVILICGIYDVYFSSYQKRASTILGTGHLPLALPLRPDASGRYTLDARYGHRVLDDLRSRVSRNESVLEDGLGLLCLKAPWVNDVSEFLSLFFPFAIQLILDMPHEIASRVGGNPILGNQLVDHVRRAAPSVIAAIKATKTEAASRASRSPMLLPRRNFASPDLDRLLENLSLHLANSAQPAVSLRGYCEDFEARHGYARIPSQRHQRCFTNDRRIEFRAPGRALHGVARIEYVSAGHSFPCFLNGRLRLGAPLTEGFHYDCHNGLDPKGSLSGMFPTCHEESREFRGRPHLNIAPNDYIRAKEPHK